MERAKFLILHLLVYIVAVFSQTVASRVEVFEKITDYIWNRCVMDCDTSVEKC